MSKPTKLQKQLSKCVEARQAFIQKAVGIDYEQTLEYYRGLHEKCRGLQKMSRVESEQLDQLEDWLLSFVNQHSKK